MPDQFIIVTGNPVDGFTFYGSFPDREQAAEHAAINLDGEDWWIAPIEDAGILEEEG
jgi:hypothetical protein